jgi:hypothetical protein
MWTCSIWLRVRSSGMHFEYGNETSWSTECQSSFQGGPYPLELIMQQKLPCMYLYLCFRRRNLLQDSCSAGRSEDGCFCHSGWAQESCFALPLSWMYFVFVFIAGTYCRTPVRLCILKTGVFVAQDTHFYRILAACRICVDVNNFLVGGNTDHQCLKICSWT